VLDLDQYNEWMTEEDYEVDEGGHKKIHKVGRTCRFCLWVKV
jgi:SWI/SNF related-matrix-associated actin-dependent regulator of chromatin subfamily C